MSLPTATQGRNRLAVLDMLRFVAAAAVVGQHSVERQGVWGRSMAATLSPGVFGVVLFFVVSGFVIPMSMPARFDLRGFAVRRVFRIYPLVLATFLTIALVGYGADIPALAHVRDATLTDWGANLLLVQDYTGAVALWGVTWTLSLEAAWYIIFAMSMLCIGRDFDRYLAVLCPVLLLALALVSVLAGHRLPLGRAGLLYAAVLGCRVYRFEVGRIGAARLLVDTGTFTFTVSACNAVSFGYFAHPNISLNQALYPWIAAPALFVAATTLPPVRNAFLNHRCFMDRLGIISFSTYLLHPLAIALAERFFVGREVLPISLVLTLALSLAGYFLVEKPGQRFGRFILSRRCMRRAERHSAYQAPGA